MAVVCSIGHSNLDWSKFIHLIECAGVSAIADVRSHPYSRFAHFSRPTLQARLNALGLPYLHLGAELGGRPIGTGDLSYAAMAETPEFEAGIGRVLDIAPRCRLALLCSEHECLECHRFLLVGRRLVERGVQMRHILRDGRIETQDEAEDRLLHKTRHTKDDLFSPRAERLDRAYRAQEQRLNTGKRAR